MAVSNDEASLHQGCHGVPGSVVGASLFHCEGGVGVHLGLRYQLCLEQVTMPRWFLGGRLGGGGEKVVCVAVHVIDKQHMMYCI